MYIGGFFFFLQILSHLFYLVSLKTEKEFFLSFTADRVRTSTGRNGRSEIFHCYLNK